jgi:hypothetical protein
MASRSQPACQAHHGWLRAPRGYVRSDDQAGRPLEIRVGGEALAVHAHAGHDGELALGFLVGDGLLAGAALERWAVSTAGRASAGGPEVHGRPAAPPCNATGLTPRAYALERG